MTLGKGTVGLLAGSLALNLILLGAVLGVLIFRTQMPPAPAGPPAPELQQNRSAMRLDGPAFFRALPPAQRRKAIALLRQNADQHRAIRKELQDVRAQLLQALTAETIDPDKVQALMQQENRAQAQERILGQKVFVELLANLDADTRAEVLRQAFRRPDRPTPPPDGRWPRDRRQN